MAASQLISQHGLGGLSMRVLAREVGLTAPTLYGYFPSKEAVVEALTIERVAIVRAYLVRAAADIEPGVPRLLAYARAYRRLALSSADFYSMIMERTGPLAETLGAVDTEAPEGLDLIRTVAEEVRHAIASGELGPVDPERTVLSLWVTAHGYVSLELAGCPPIALRSDEERETAYLSSIEAMLRGLEVTSGATAIAHPGV
ncbi:MAG TPA: TetR/AcrR family transcriptional regulator [Thermomicrobiales bacterium]|nr:TetR/AcrR family transcriptional regulator [Thermomicrobiales bacterium]